MIKGLKRFNMDGFRSSVEYDRKFIKVLLVACIGIASVCFGQMDPFAIEFIKGKTSSKNEAKNESFHILFFFLFSDLFVIRCDGDDVRIGRFEETMKRCCDELIDRFK